MRYLSLFSGAMGGDLAMQHLIGMECVGYVEWDKYCQKVIRQRQEDGFADVAPIFGDIREFINQGYAGSYTGLVDVVTGGFPCQPFSVAGKQLGVDDPRNMWPSTADVIRIVRPRYCLLENVPGIREYLPVVVRDLRRLGYTVSRPLQLGADDVGAPHRRTRVWIFAHSERNEQQFSCNGENRRVGWVNKYVPWHGDWEGALRELRGMDDGLAYRVERTDSIRNGQVPIVAATAWNLLGGK